MKRVFTAAVLATFSAVAAAEPVVMESAGSVPETVDRLKAAVEAAGGKVFGIIDFGSVIRGIGEDVGEVQLVIFGDPRIGAQALSADRMAALDLPGKVLIYDTAQASAMAYQQPEEMLAEWDIPANAPVMDEMSRTLDAVTAVAAQ